MEPNWEHIKEVWERGAEDLSAVADQYQVTVPSITLKAQSEGWADRGSVVPLCPDLNVPILTEKEVLLAHKTDLGRLRLLAATIMETLQYENDGAAVLKAIEKLARIYTQVIPLERKTFGLDEGTSDMPDGITINVGGGNEKN